MLHPVVNDEDPSSELSSSNNFTAGAPVGPDLKDLPNEALDQPKQTFPIHAHHDVTISAGTPILSGYQSLSSLEQTTQSIPTHTHLLSNPSIASQSIPFPSCHGVLIHPSLFSPPLNQVSSSTHGVFPIPYNVPFILPRYPLPQDFLNPIVSHSASSIEHVSTTLPISFYTASNPLSSSKVLEKDMLTQIQTDETATPSISLSPPLSRDGNSIVTQTNLANSQAHTKVLPRPSFWNQHSLMAYHPDPNFANYSFSLQNATHFDPTILPTATCAMGVPIHTEPSASSSSKSRRKKGGSDVDASTQVSKSDFLPNSHHFLMPASEAMKLISPLTWQEKTVYVARHLLGGRTVNGFLQATSMARRYKKRRARQLTRHAISGKKTQIDFDEVEKLLSEESNDQATSDEKISDEATEEVLKKITMNEYMARRLVAEMAFGITYCDTVSSVIESILEEMSPFKRQTPQTKKSTSSTHLKKSRVEAKSIEPLKGSVAKAPSLKRAKSETGSIPAIEASSSSVAGSTEGDRRPGSSLFSTLRPLRTKKQRIGTLPPIEDIQFVMSISNRKEKMIRVFDTFRFRPLQVGDFVAVRPTSQDVWILSRVVMEWNLPRLISCASLINMAAIKRESILSNHRVYVQDHEDYGSVNPSTIKNVARSLVLPLPRSISEGNQWCSFLCKGARVYAMYPSTTALYPCTVVDSTTFCQGDNDIVVVEFDGDEDEQNIIVPKHIPSRFTTLIPSENESSQIITKKLRSTR